MREEIQGWKEKSMIKMEQDDNDRRGREFEAILTWLKIDGSEQMTILEAVSAERHLYPGTSAWLLRNEKIKLWLKKSPELPVLWLHGNPGTGKSALSAELIHWLQSSGASVIHHFCTYTYASSTTYEGILRSLLLQAIRNDGDLVDHVYHEYVLTRELATITMLEYPLQTVIAQEPWQSECLWILVDALNECEAAEQQKLSSLFSRLASVPADQTGMSTSGREHFGPLRFGACCGPPASTMQPVFAKRRWTDVVMKLAPSPALQALTAQAGTA